MSRPTQAQIDLAAIRHNYRHAKQLAPHSRAMAVIKANAYGHGAVRVAQTLADCADAFAVACVGEAWELREAGIQNPIVLFEGVFSADELQEVDAARCSVVVHTMQQVQWLLAAKLRHPLWVFLKIETGMHRLGLAAEHVADAYAQLQACAHVQNIVLMSHFARADETQADFTRQQIACFQRLKPQAEMPCSLCNSAGILAWSEAHLEWIRPGVMLYGVDPLDRALSSAQALRPTMRLTSELIAVHQLQAGDAIGYGGRFVCERACKVGVVALGYGDGYPRHAQDGTPVAVNGQRTRLIGRVSMDMLTVDLSTVADARIGSPVELWGEHIPINEVAASCDTIAYTLLAGLTRRVPLHYD